MAAVLNICLMSAFIVAKPLFLIKTSRISIDLYMIKDAISCSRRGVARLKILHFS